MFFITVSDDTNDEEFISGREVLWDKIGLPVLRLPYGLGQGLAGGEPCSVGWSQL